MITDVPSLMLLQVVFYLAPNHQEPRFPRWHGVFPRAAQEYLKDTKECIIPKSSRKIHVSLKSAVYIKKKAQNHILHTF